MGYSGWHLWREDDLLRFVEQGPAWRHPLMALQRRARRRSTSARDRIIRELYVFIVSELDPDPVAIADYLAGTGLGALATEIVGDLDRPTLRAVASVCTEGEDA